jgi:hypothetical protein
MAFILANGKQQYFDDNGDPLAAGKLWTMQPGPGVTTPKNTWSDAGETSLNTNPIILNARGEAQVFWNGAYNVRLETAAGGLIYTVESITTAYSDTVLRADLASTAVGKGAALVGYLPGVTGAVATTVQAKLRQTVSLFDFMTAAQIADVQAGTRLLNVTTAVQAAFDYAKAVTDRELQIDIPAGDYAVNTLSLYRCHNVVLNVMGSAYFTGVSASEAKLLSVNGADGDFTRRMVINGILRFQNIGGTAYQYGVYFKGVTDSHLLLSVSGAYSEAAIYLDVCFNNIGELTASNSTSNKHLILCDQNNVNINRFRVRCAGTGAATGQIGLEAAGNGNEWYGDISSCQYGVKLVAAKGSTFLFYMEVVGAPVTCSGTSRGISFQGGYYEIQSSSTCFDFSGGTVQGLHMAGMRLVGVNAGSARQLFNWGSAAYSVTLGAYDAAAFDTESTGTLRGSSGGIADQLFGAVRHRSNGVASLLGGSSKVFIAQTVSGAGTVTLDASLGDVRSLTVSTAGAVVIGAPTNPTAGQEMTIEVRNTSGGALTLSWNAAFKLAAWTSPANTFGRSITFIYDGTNWKEVSRVSVDVPN